MKVNKKICIMILTGIYIFFISIFNVKALTTADYTNEGNVLNISITSPNTGIQTYFPSTNAQGYRQLFPSYGEGNVLFTFQTSSYDTSITSQLTEVEARLDNGNSFVCQLGTAQGYLDSNNQIIIFTANCPINIASGRYLRYLYFKRAGGAGKLDISVGSIISFVSKDSATNSSVIQADLYTIQQYQIDINNNISQFKNATHQDLEAIKNALENNNTTITNIENKMNEDLDNDTKTAPDQTQYNNAKQQEENIIQSISNVSANDITFSQDLQATNKIWDTTTRFLQTNAKVMGLVISILSIGIIKLIMNR